MLIERGLGRRGTGGIRGGGAQPEAQTAGLQVVESEELMVDRKPEAQLLRVGPAVCAVPSNAIARGVDAWHGEGGGVLKRDEKPAGLPVNGRFSP